MLGTNLNAIALYANKGFEIEGCLRNEFVLDGQLVDDVITARKLHQEVARKS